MRDGSKGQKKLIIEERVLHDINSFLRTSFSDQRLRFVSITKVEISNDYSYAKVYWDTFEQKSRGDAKKALEGGQKRFRAMLSETLNIRHTPQIQFIYDSQFEDENKIAAILDEEAKLGKFPSKEDNE